MSEKPDREALMERIRLRLAEKAQFRSDIKPSGPPPRYDDVYWRGMEWLDKQ